MNRKEFIKSVACMAGAVSMAPVASASVSRVKSGRKVTLKKGLGLGMIKEDLSLADKFKLAKDLGFDGIELNSPTEFTISETFCVTVGQNIG